MRQDSSSLGAASIRTCLLILLLALLPLLSGCALAKMAVPESVQESCDAYPIEVVKRMGKDAPIYRFGPFEARLVGFHDQRRTGFSFVVARKKVTEKLSFEIFGSDGQSLSANCDVTWQEKGVDLGGAGDYTGERREMTCRWTGRDDVEVATLKIEIPGEGYEGQEVGALTTSDGTKLTITMTMQQADWDLPMSEATGFFLREGEQIVAAADALNYGIVYIGKGETGARALILAAASVALVEFGGWKAEED